MKYQIKNDSSREDRQFNKRKSTKKYWLKKRDTRNNTALFNNTSKNRIFLKCKR